MDDIGIIPDDLIASPLRVGTAPVNWNNNDLPNWRPLVPFPEILDEMARAGYAATEWDESFGADVDDLNLQRQRREMVFTGAYRWFDFLDDDRYSHESATILPLLETLQGTGVHHLIVSDRLREHRVACSGFVPQDGSASLNDAGYKKIAANLAQLCEDARSYDLRVHYHNHAGTYVETPVELATLINHLDLDTVDLCFDTGHYAFGGGDAFTFIEEHLPAIGYLHLKDVDPDVLGLAKTNRWSFLDALRHYIFCPLGEGNARIPEIVRHLTGEGFRNYVIVEQDTCRGDATANGRHNLSVVLSSGSADRNLRFKT